MVVDVRRVDEVHRDAIHEVALAIDDVSVDEDELVGGGIAVGVAVDEVVTPVVDANAVPVVEVVAGARRVTLASDTRLDARVQVGVDALIDGAPGALDTLNELAAAVADDASYAASVTAALAAKANSADVYTRTELGDPTTSYVTTFEAALT